MIKRLTRWHGKPGKTLRENNFAIWLLGVGAGAALTVLVLGGSAMVEAAPLAMAWLAVLVSYWLMVAGFYIAKAPAPDELAQETEQESRVS